jgi:hypothetical protein
MWLAIYKPKRFSLSWLTNWVRTEYPIIFSVFISLLIYQQKMTLCVHQMCIILGVLLMILSPIGGLRQIIMDAKTYQFYS